MVRFAPKTKKNILPKNSINKILIIRLSSLGDILLATPVIRTVKLKYPEAQVDFILKKEYQESLKFNPNISNLYCYEKNEASRLKDRIQSEKYDIIIDLQNNFRSRKLISGIDSEIKRFSKPTLKKLLLVHLKINLLKNLKTIPERYADAAGVELDNKSLELFLPADIKTNLPDENFIGFCPGAKHFTKRWLPEYFIELGNELTKLGFTIILFGGKSDKEICKSISNQISGCINMQNDDRLLKTAAEMKKCRLIVSNDSGLMHTASAVGVKFVTIFGSTVREFGFAPIGSQNLILENNSLSCRPCSHIGKSTCPKKHFKCMKDITPQIVLGHLQNILIRL